MIKIIIFKDSLENIQRYTINGHANYAPYGEDIVCASVATLGQVTLLSLVEICGIKEEEILYKLDDDKGYLDVNIPVKLANTTLNNTQIVLKTFELGVKSIIEGYPKYVTLEYREV